MKRTISQIIHEELPPELMHEWEDGRLVCRHCRLGMQEIRERRDPALCPARMKKSRGP